jgi:hypothetical protein
MKQLLQGARSVGPYLLVEALLPGGTLIAILLWLFQRRARKGNSVVPEAGTGRLCTSNCP